MNMPLGVDIPSEDGNVQQPRHPLSWQSQGQLLTCTRHLQKLAEKRLLRSLCCRPNCTVERHIPVFHPCAVLNRPAPAAIFTGFIRWTVARCVIVVAIGANKIWTCALRLFGIWSQVIGQNKAAINSMSAQRQCSVIMAKPQAEVENVYQTPLWWHQFAQLLLAQGCCNRTNLTQSSRTMTCSKNKKRLPMYLSKPILTFCATKQSLQRSAMPNKPSNSLWPNRGRTKHPQSPCVLRAAPWPRKIPSRQSLSDHLTRPGLST